MEIQLQYQFEIEEAYPNFITRRAYQIEYVEKPNKAKLDSFHRYVVDFTEEKHRIYLNVIGMSVSILNNSNVVFNWFWKSFNFALTLPEPLYAKFIYVCMLSLKYFYNIVLLYSSE